MSERATKGSRRQVPVRVRCAIYTRKSTEEGLDQEFSSLDAQRTSAEAFIESQAHAAWVCLRQSYDDGGYSGANLERPALQQLIADVEAGKIDCVVVYKVDRLSRSLLDFARLMESFDRYGVSFVSITQQFNTTTSMGRLVLNVLLSFAQFEREMIAERTRDKIAATRRKGKWAGLSPRLGYDVQHSKAVVNEAEAQRVREIFALYLQQPSLTFVVQELARRKWPNKGWTTRKGTPCGGRAFTKEALRQLLRNVVYIGQLRYKDETYTGEHPAIVDPLIFREVQRALGRNAHRRNRTRNDPALLRGLLYCGACDCPMLYRYAVKRQRRYPYYLCQQASRHGWQRCPAPSLPGREVERAVIDQLFQLASDDRLPAHWNSLPLSERVTLVDRLIERIVYDHQSGQLSIAYRQDGLQSLVNDLFHRASS